ncbi:MAG: DUF1571 domain-containing protein [Rubripirellula sp.]
MQRSQKKPLFAVCVAIGMIAGYTVYRMTRTASGESATAAPTMVQKGDDKTNTMTMSDLLDMAQAARDQLSTSMNDYSARFVKQEIDAQGVLGPETEIRMKVQTRLRNDSNDAPMRVYLRFTSPDNVNGREVIWAEDLYDGKMAVHEVGLLLGLKTIWLDPNGIIAMQGQRYPISEIGLVKLVEKLIERGEKDRDNPAISVTLSSDHKLGDTDTQLIQIRRSEPSNEADDFSLAEIVIDPERQIVLSYRAFGWPDIEGGEPPLLESYTYYDVQSNIGLSEKDFDPKSPEYNFPSI